MSEAEKNNTPDPDEPAGFAPSTSPAQELTKGQLRYLKRKEYMREYARKNGHKRNTGRPPGRRPKPKQTEPARAKNQEAIWSPQYREDGTPGPQFALLSCPFPEIFFGGARGGGKTDGAIGKWLQHAHRYGPDAKGVFFRRRFKQLEEVQSRCAALFPRLGATYHKGDANWVFPNGALLKLRHLWDVAATEEYQGHNYCVARGTPVLMADGSYKPIETIQVSEKVMTLDGPKSVTGRMAPKVKPCVLAEVFDPDGQKIGEQIHPEDHPVLTSVLQPHADHSHDGQAPSLRAYSQGSELAEGPLHGVRSGSAFRHNRLPSDPSVQVPDRQQFDSCQTSLRQPLSPSPWQSYKSLLDEHRESLGTSACPEDGRSGYTGSADELRECLRPLRLSAPVVLHAPDLLSDGQCQQTSTQCRAFGISCGQSPEPAPKNKAECVDQQPQTAQDQSYLHRSMVRLPGGAHEHDLLGSHRDADCLDHCSKHHHRCDELSQSDPEISLAFSPSPDDAETRIRTGERADVLEHTGEYSQPYCVSYIHPYTGKGHKVHQRYRFGRVVFQPCGLHEVFDLTVQDANHYITESQLVNRNSFLVFEELTNWSTPDAIDRMRGTLRSAKGVPVELIMTGNPGGSGHCVPYGEVLTPSGWKDISHFQVGDPVMTVTDKGEIVQSEASQVHKSRYTGMMAAISQNGVTMVCTPNHKIGIVNSNKTKIALKPFNELGSGFSIPRVLISQGKESRLDESGRSELHITAEAVKMLDYDGDVYCIGVPQTHSFIIRQNGFVWVSGNSWVKQRYISPAPQGWTPIKDEETGAYRIYIPSRLEDNTAMMKNDPTYAARLRGTGSAALVNAWLKGDWDIVAGGFFDDLIVPDIHFLTPFHIPSTWSYRRSFDWGSASPASLGIWAVSDGNPVPDLDGFTFPRGSLIRIKEWYTCAKTKTGDIVPNEGLRLTNLALGEGIAQRSLGYRFSGCVADPSIYSKLGRESIYDEMRKGAADAGHNLIMSPADNNRIGGWQKMRDMLENARADRPEKPGLWVFETCHHWLRTVPVMQRSDTDFDDVDTTQEDHCLHGDTLVETRDGHIPIRNLVGKVGEARQANGQYMIFWGCRLTRQDAETITIMTKDRRSITCTPDHRILTTEGWVEAKDTMGMTLVSTESNVPRSAESAPEVVSIEEAGRHDVFNLEVEHTHAFAVNGGLIVHNCADDTRYVCMTGARQLKIGALVGR